MTTVQHRNWHVRNAFLGQPVIKPMLKQQPGYRRAAHLRSCQQLHSISAHTSTQSAGMMCLDWQAYALHAFKPDTRYRSHGHRCLDTARWSDKTSSAACSPADSDSAGLWQQLQRLYCSFRHFTRGHSAGSAGTRVAELYCTCYCCVHVVLSSALCTHAEQKLCGLCS